MKLLTTKAYNKLMADLVDAGLWSITAQTQVLRAKHLARKQEDKIAELEEIISYMPKAPTEPYEKMLAKELVELIGKYEKCVEALNYYGFSLVADSLNSGNETITTQTGLVARKVLKECGETE